MWSLGSGSNRHLANYKFAALPVELPRQDPPPARPSRTSVDAGIASAALAVLLLLSACADKPPIVSADTSCERFRHISATPAQIKVYQDNWEVMESYADQVLEHNLEYDGHCLKDAAK